MIPLFKSHYSIGKSILTLERESKEGGADSIVEIAQKNKLPYVCMVEDTLIGFFTAEKIFRELGIPLYFGLRVSYRNDCGEKDSESKIVIFAKNMAGAKKLNKIYTNAHTTHFNNKGKIEIYLTKDFLSEIWSDEDLKLAIPFYDGFVFKNVMSFSSCVFDLEKFSPTFFIEDNGLPFDGFVKRKVLEFCRGKDFPTESVKSVYYKDKDDVLAFQTYKLATGRGFSSKPPSIECPNLDHFSSNEFCFESWKENQ